jgi:hypothetical protein
MVSEFMLLYLTSSAMLILLWKTKSLQVSISTTFTVVGIGIAGIFGTFGSIEHMVLILIALITVLVWRVIPHNKQDVWSKV